MAGMGFRSSFRILMLPAIVLLCGNIVFGQTLAQKLQMETIYKAKAPIVIPITADEGKATVDFPSIPAQDGKIPFIRFRALCPVKDYQDRLADAYLKIEVNGKVLGETMPDDSYRLLNRGTRVHNSDGWFSWWDDSKLVVYLGHETGEMDPRVIEPRGEDYWYAVNISDAAEYVKNGLDNRIIGGKPNRIVFTNTCRSTSANPVPSELRIQGLEVGYLTKKDVEKIQPVTLLSVPKLSGETLFTKGSTLTLTSSGAMEVDCGGESYAIQSAYSYPSTDKMGYHQFTWTDTKDSDWTFGPLIRYGSFGMSVKGECARYSVNRQVRAKDGEYHVTDTIENKTDEPLGMSIRYEVATPARIPDEKAYLSGIPGLKANDRCGANPTALLIQPGGSLGVAVEDIVLSYQLGMVKKTNSVQFGTERFGLEPHKSYTIAWTLFPSKAQDYFSFINQVRSDWGVNYTIPGPWVHGEEKLPGIKAKLYSMNPWLFYSNGVMYNREQTVELLKKESSALLAAQPDAIPMARLEAPLVGVRRKNLVNGDKIPRSPKILGLELTPEQAEILKGSPFWDSMRRSSRGLPYIDTYYAEAQYDDFNLMVYPVIGNSQFKHLWDEIDMAMDEGGCKGIYIDMFEMGESLMEDYRPDYSKWDGHTVDLNLRGEIASKITDTALVSVPARVELLKHILAKGGVAVANMHPCAMELRHIPYVSFAEADWEQLPDYAALLKLLTPVEPSLNARMAMSHLCSPVSMGVGLWRRDLFYSPPTPKDFGKNNQTEIIQKYVIACLRNGSLYYAYNNISTEGPGAGEEGIIDEMFPFTPVELHEGYLIGKEKILTAVSGIFLWNIIDHPVKPSVCKAFDTKGHKVAPKSFSVTRVGNQWKVSVVLQADWNGTAAIY